MDCISDLHKKVLLTGGITIGNTGFIFTKVWWVLHKSFVFARVYYGIGSVALMVLYIHDFGFFMAGFIGLLFVLQTLIREIIVKLHYKKIVGIYYEYLQILDESNSDIYDLKQAVKDVIKKNDSSTKNRLVLEISTSMFIIVAAVQNLISSSRELPCVNWNAFDTTTQPNNFIVCIIQYLTVSSTLIMCVGQENVYMTLIRLQLAHGQYLIQHLKLINDMAEAHPYRALSQTTQWISQHHRYLRNGNVLRDIFSPMLFVTYSVVFSFLFASAVSWIEPTYELSQKLVIYLFCSMYLVALYKFCALVDELHATTQSYMRESFTFNFITKSKELALTTLMVQVCSIKSLKLSAYGFYPLCRQCFGMLLQATFSFVVSVMQIQNARAAHEDNNNK